MGIFFYNLPQPKVQADLQTSIQPIFDAFYSRSEDQRNYDEFVRTFGEFTGKFSALMRVGGTIFHWLHIPDQSCANSIRTLFCAGNTANIRHQEKAAALMAEGRNK